MKTNVHLRANINYTTVSTLKLLVAVIEVRKLALRLFGFILKIAFLSIKLKVKLYYILAR